MKISDELAAFLDAAEKAEIETISVNASPQPGVVIVMSFHKDKDLPERFQDLHGIVTATSNDPIHAGYYCTHDL